MPTLADALNTITRIRQNVHDLYWDRDEDGHMRRLLPVEEWMLAEHTAINVRFASHLDHALRVHNRNSEAYAMIAEAAAKQQAIELQRAWHHMINALENRKEHQ